MAYQSRSEFQKGLQIEIEWHVELYWQCPIKLKIEIGYIFYSPHPAGQPQAKAGLYIAKRPGTLLTEEKNTGPAASFKPGTKPYGE
jgi:hypothetical protein